MIKQNQQIELNSRLKLVSPADNSPRSGAAAHLAEFVRHGENDSLQKVERSIHFMVANVNRPLQISTLAAQVNVSPSHFFALFKQMTGRPPMDYFTKLRMSHACRLLDSTSASVKEVAAALGYHDQFYFSRVFKSVNGVPPREYRVITAGLEYTPKNAPLEPFERKTFESLVSCPLNRNPNSRISHYLSAKPNRNSRVRKSKPSNKTNP